MPANRAALDWHLDAPPGARTDLLFDPQTCGGLLAVVPAARAAALVEAIEGAAVIGHLTGGPARITLA
jgi:selenide,water dikinase